MKPLIFLCVVFAIAGCATQENVTFDRPNTTAQQISQDFAACQLSAMQMPDRGTAIADEMRQGSVIGNIIRAQQNAERPRIAAQLCMEAQGYSLVIRPNGVPQPSAYETSLERVNSYNHCVSVHASEPAQCGNPPSQ